jgi:hypothetical protein
MVSATNASKGDPTTVYDTRYMRAEFNGSDYHCSEIGAPCLKCVPKSDMELSFANRGLSWTTTAARRAMSGLRRLRDAGSGQASWAAAEELQELLI